MDKYELQTILISERFDPRTYSLNQGELKDEALCLRVDGHRWSVYYSERGLETGKVYFADENAACEYFLDEMRSDPTTKIDWKSGFHM